MSRRSAYGALALACALPRVGVLLHERGAILAANTEKSDTFAQTFVAHGTFGFIPGFPSAYTQPLYGWFLVPVYWIFGRSWPSVGLAQIAVAVGTAWLVYEIGRRVLAPRAAVAAAAIATLNPYLVWHDVHVNREILDQACAAALVLLTLAVAERPSRPRAALLGVVGGLALLGNVRLVFLPVLCVAYLAWRLPRTRATLALAALVLGAAGVTVAPWLVRNKVSVGCWAVTTDGRALWKGNNLQTYGLLSSGKWIDNVVDPPRPQPPDQWTPEEAWAAYVQPGGEARGRRLYPDECRAMGFYEHLTVRYWRHHPGDKLKLAALSEQLLWQPNVIETSASAGGGARVDLGRRVLEPVYMWALYALAALGLLLVPRSFAVLALLLFAYQSAVAALFVGATRYRIAWDFLLALLAAAALARAAAWARERRARA